MKFAALACLILTTVTGCGLLATKEQRENAPSTHPVGLLAPEAHDTLVRTKEAVDNLRTDPTISTVPYVNVIAGTISAILGGVILIDRQFEKKRAVVVTSS